MRLFTLIALLVAFTMFSPLAPVLHVRAMPEASLSQNPIEHSYSEEQIPWNVTVGSITDSRAAISWKTDGVADGGVVYGYSPDNLDSMMYDMDDNSYYVDTTHIVHLRGLSRTATVYFRIVSNGVFYGGGENGGVESPGVPWSFTTFHLIHDLFFPNFLEVCVTLPDNTPANRVLGFFFFSRPGATSNIAIGISDPYGFFGEDGRRNGSIRINLQSLRKPDGTKYSYSNGDTITFRLDGGHRGTYPAGDAWDSSEEFHMQSADGQYMGVRILEDAPPPIVRGVDPDEAILGEPVQMFAEVFAASPVEVAMHYNQQGTWNNIQMTLYSGTYYHGLWTVVIVPLESGEMEYYYAVFDGAKNSTSHTYILDVDPRPPHSIQLFLPEEVVAGESTLAEVHVFDDLDNPTPPQNRILFSSSDTNAIFTMDDGSGWEDGVKNFHVTLFSAGVQSISIVHEDMQWINDSGELLVLSGSVFSLSIHPSAVSLVAGDLQEFSIDTWDEYGNPISAEALWSIGGGIGVVDQNGMFEATTLGIGYVNATVSGVIVSAAVGVSAGRPGQLSACGSRHMNGTVGNELPDEFKAVVYDDMGNPVEGALVAWSIASQPYGAGAALSNTLAYSDEYGVARTMLTIGKWVGDYSVRATISGLGHVEFNATAFPGVPDSIDVEYPSFLEAGASARIEVSVVDIYGNINSSVGVEHTLQSQGATFEDGYFRDTFAGVSKLYFEAVDYHLVSVVVEIEITPSFPASILLPWDVLTLFAGDQVALQADAYDQYGNINISWQPIWSTTMGEINGKRLYAGTTAGQGTLSVSAGSPGDPFFVSKSIGLNVSPDRLARILLYPQTLIIGLSAQREILANGYDQYGNNIPLVPQWNVSPNIGEVQNGVFKPYRTGSAKVFAQCCGISSSLNITVWDDNPPSVHASIEEGETLSVGSNIFISFSKEMNMESVVNNLGLWKKDSGDSLSPIPYRYEHGPTKIEIRPAEKLEYGSTYTLVLAPSQDIYGVNTRSLLITFTTPDAEEEISAPTPDPGGPPDSTPVDSSNTKGVFSTVEILGISVIPFLFFALVAVLIIISIFSGMRNIRTSKKTGQDARTHSSGVYYDSEDPREPDFSDIIAEKRAAGDPFYSDSPENHRR